MKCLTSLTHPLHDFFADFLSAAACGDLCRSVGRNWMVSFLPRQLTCHHTQQLIGRKFTNFRQLLVITCELPRQETNHLVTTHAPTQVTTIRSWLEESNTFLAAFSDGLWVAEAGNWPFGYDPRSYTSQHRQQLLGGKLSNFRQVLVITRELPRQETDPIVTTHTPTQVTTGSSWSGTNLQISGIF